jgi:hypothetical protein
MPAHVIASRPLDLLAVIPELIGFEPSDSLVLVALHGTTTCGTLRIDLPSQAERASEQLTAYASTALGFVCKMRGAEAVLPVVFTERSCDGGEPCEALVAALRAQASAAGLRVPDVLYVTADAWGSYGAARRARSELDAARELRRLDPDFSVVHESASAEAMLSAEDPARVARTSALLEDLENASRSQHGMESVPDPVWFAEYSLGWDPEGIGPAAAALTAHVLGRPWARDVALFTWSWGRGAGQRALRFQERWRRGAPLRDERLATALAGAATLGRPSAEAVEHAIAMLRRVAAMLPDDRRAPVLASLAWLNWALGRSSVASRYAVRARECDPRYGFAELVETMLGRGLLPEWAFTEPAA